MIMMIIIIVVIITKNNNNDNNYNILNNNNSNNDTSNTDAIDNANNTIPGVCGNNNPFARASPGKTSTLK